MWNFLIAAAAAADDDDDESFCCQLPAAELGEHRQQVSWRKFAGADERAISTTSLNYGGGGGGGHDDSASLFAYQLCSCCCFDDVFAVVSAVGVVAEALLRLLLWMSIILTVDKLSLVAAAVVRVDAREDPADRSWPKSNGCSLLVFRLQKNDGVSNSLGSQTNRAPIVGDTRTLIQLTL